MMLVSKRNTLELRHGYHLVDPSPWPLLVAFSAPVTVGGLVLYMHAYSDGGVILGLGLFLVCCTSGFWWRDVVREATFEGHHTAVVCLGLRLGMLLFIISEIFFFLAFFWAFFHSSLAPTVEIGALWPPYGISILDPWKVPLLNTLILLLSGGSVTWSHHALVRGYRKEALAGLVSTVVSAIISTGLQGFEYYGAGFNISDSIYGSVFYLATGFHGFHGVSFS